MDVLIKNYFRGFNRDELKNVYKMIGEEIKEWSEKGIKELNENILEILETCKEIIKEEREKESIVNIDTDGEEAAFAGELDSTDDEKTN